jgi:hypothetical protein
MHLHSSAHLSGKVVNRDVVEFAGPFLSLLSLPLLPRAGPSTSHGCSRVSMHHASLVDKGADEDNGMGRATS